jgi:UDP-N-acetylmuramate dehydrogenase
MSFSRRHANFLVNAGQGTFAQAMELIAAAREAVQRRSGFSLELEVRVWP